MLGPRRKVITRLGEWVNLQSSGPPEHFPLEIEDSSYVGAAAESARGGKYFSTGGLVIFFLTTPIYIYIYVLVYIYIYIYI